MNIIWSKHIGFILGVIIICGFTLLSVFAYLIIPDKTIHANDQIPLLALKSPGYSQLFYKQKLLINNKESSYSFIKGKPIEFQLIPIKKWTLDNEHFNYVPLKGLSKEISLSQLNVEGLQKDKIEEQLLTNRTFWFGTDKYGRDIFSRLILGLRVSLFVGLIAVSISILLGTFIGLVSGYFGGIIDQIIQYVINTFWSIPTILLVFAIVAGFGRSITVIFIAVGLTMWVDVARLVRGQVISLKEQNYIAVAKTIGTPHFSILSKHILPNLLSSLFVIAAANFAIAILIEAGLSYLGFGVQPPIPSLGNMLNENYGFALSGKIFMAVIPATAIMLLVLAFNLAGNGLRDIFDVKQ